MARSLLARSMSGVRLVWGRERLPEDIPSDAAAAARAFRGAARTGFAGCAVCVIGAALVLLLTDRWWGLIIGGILCVLGVVVMLTSEQKMRRSSRVIRTPR